MIVWTSTADEEIAQHRESCGGRLDLFICPCGQTRSLGCALPLVECGFIVSSFQFDEPCEHFAHVVQTCDVLDRLN